MSKPVLVGMLNSLFGENFDPELVEIAKENAKFVNERLEVIEGDLFLRITPDFPSKPYIFHIEFQTLEDKSMAIRVLRYDISKAIELQKLSEKIGDKIVLYMPKSLVTHIEPGENIPDEYELEIVFADGETKTFSVDVMKYWEYDDKRLIKDKLYPLLPLQVFLLRSKLKKIARSKKGDKREAIEEAKKLTEKIAREVAKLRDKKIIDGSDSYNIVRALENIFVYLNNRYKGEKKYNEEVNSMLVDLYSPEIFAKGETKGEHKKAVETAKKMLLKNKPIDEIIEFTDLSKDEILEIKDEIKNK